MIGGSSGIIQLEIVRLNADLSIGYNKLVNVSYGASASSFQQVLNSFDGFSSYMITVNRYIYDSNETLLPSTVGAARIDYICSFYKLRPASISSEKFKVTYFNYTGKFTENVTQYHSPLVTGTFTLRIANADILVNNSTNIPFNVPAATLQTAIRSSGIVGFNYIEVSRFSPVSCDYACNWTI